MHPDKDLSKKYGASFINSLPKMKTIIGQTDELAEDIRNWLRQQIKFCSQVMKDDTIIHEFREGLSASMNNLPIAKESFPFLLVSGMMTWFYIA